MKGGEKEKMRVKLCDYEANYSFPYLNVKKVNKKEGINTMYLGGHIKAEEYSPFEGRFPAAIK